MDTSGIQLILNAFIWGASIVAFLIPFFIGVPILFRIARATQNWFEDDYETTAAALARQAHGRSPFRAQAH